MSTLFDKIIAGEIPSHKIYEDEDTFAFLDINPVATGHVLVVPKNSTEFVWDLEKDNYASLLSATQKIAKRLREVMKTKYVGSQIVGVDVPHAHIHLIPFNEVAEFRNKPDASAPPDHEALAKIATQIRFE